MRGAPRGPSLPVVHRRVDAAGAGTMRYAPRPAIRLLPLALVLLTATPVGAQTERAPRPYPDAPATAYVDGQWYDGAWFVRGDRYAVDGVFTAERSARVDTTVSVALAGRTLASARLGPGAVLPDTDRSNDAWSPE